MCLSKSSFELMFGCIYLIASAVIWLAFLVNATFHFLNQGPQWCSAFWLWAHTVACAWTTSNHSVQSLKMLGIIVVMNSLFWPPSVTWINPGRCVPDVVYTKSAAFCVGNFDAIQPNSQVPTYWNKKSNIIVTFCRNSHKKLHIIIYNINPFVFVWSYKICFALIFTISLLFNWKIRIKSIK